MICIDLSLGEDVLALTLLPFLIIMTFSTECKKG